jgi:hypothetical protein
MPSFTLRGEIKFHFLVECSIQQKEDLEGIKK